MATVTDKNSIINLLKKNACKAKEENIYAIWQWEVAATREIKYEIIYNIAESNDFEFSSNAANKVRFYEKGNFDTAGREFLDGPDWLEKEQSKLPSIFSGNLEEPCENMSNPQHVPIHNKTLAEPSSAVSTNTPSNINIHKILRLLIPFGLGTLAVTFVIFFLDKIFGSWNLGEFFYVLLFGLSSAMVAVPILVIGLLPPER